MPDSEALLLFITKLRSYDSELAGNWPCPSARFWGSHPRTSARIFSARRWIVGYGKIDSPSRTGTILMRPLVCWFLICFSFSAQAQVRAPGGKEFQITKITKNLVATPDYGIGQYRSAANERWLE